MSMFSEFKTPRHSDWLTQVEKELKEPAVPYLITKELLANPYSDRKETSPIQYIKEKEGWIISQKADTNEEILESLEGGVSGISLVCTAESDFDQLLSEVYIDLITLRIEVDSSDYAFVFINLMEYIVLKRYDIHQLDIVVSGLTISEFNFINARFNHTLSFEIHASESSSESLAELLLRSEQHINTNTKLVLNLYAAENFYVNIANLKSVRHIWKKLEEANSVSSSMTRVFVKIAAQNKDQNLQAIALTQMMASSAIAGAEWVEINNITYPESKYSRSFSRRISRNIQHILSSESFLGRVDDAAAGSYFIDDLTRKLIALIWAKFLSNHE